MAGRRRRGSSTRRHKIPLSGPKPKQETKVKVPPVTPSTEDDKRAIIAKLEAQIRSGINVKGQPLTDKEIGVFLTAISGLEHTLGIKHYHDSGIHSARH